MSIVRHCRWRVGLRWAGGCKAWFSLTDKHLDISIRHKHMHKDIRTRRRAYLTQFSTPALLKPMINKMINKMADEASAILLMRSASKWPMIGPRPRCACAYVVLSSQSCDIIISTSTRRANLSIFLVLILMPTQFSLAYTCDCAYTYAYALVKTRLFFKEKRFWPWAYTSYRQLTAARHFSTVK